MEEVLVGSSGGLSLESVEIEVTWAMVGVMAILRTDGTCEFGSQPFATCVRGCSGSTGGSDEWRRCPRELN
jgi:hypothetical protein